MACCSSSAKRSKCGGNNNNSSDDEAEDVDEGHCCPVCMDAYDAMHRVPKVLTSCGHTLCAPCINAMVQAKTCVIGRLRYAYQVGCCC